MNELHNVKLVNDFGIDGLTNLLSSHLHAKLGLADFIVDLISRSGLFSVICVVRVLTDNFRCLLFFRLCYLLRDLIDLPFRI